MYPFPSLVNIAINCKTQQESDELAHILNILGYKWTDGSRIDKESMCWVVYKDKAAYNILQGTQGEVSSFIENGFLVINFETFKRAFLNTHPVSWYVETLFDPSSNNYKYRLFTKRFLKKRYLKDLEGKIHTILSFEEALNLSKFLKYFNLNSLFDASKIN